MKCFLSIIGCNFPLKAHGHHIVPASLCGPSHGWNMLPLCPNHHAEVHALFPDKEIEDLIEGFDSEIFWEIFDMSEDENEARLSTGFWADCMEEFKGRFRGKEYESLRLEHALDPVRMAAASIMYDLYKHFNLKEDLWHPAFEPVPCELIHYEPNPDARVVPISVCYGI